jgi:flagellar motor switch protein FliN/FliY
MDKHMTTTTANALEGLIENCRKAWGDALSRVVGTACEVQVVHDAGAMPPSPAVCTTIQAEGALSGQAAFVIDEHNAALLSSKVGTSASGPQSVQDLLRQTVVFAFNEFQKQFGQTRVQVATAKGLNFQPQTARVFLAGNGSADPLRVYFLFNSEVASGAQPSNTSLTTPAPTQMDRRNLQLVMGVELEVTLRFGQRKLPLRQLLELNPGSIVELDKRVHEPVELLLHEKVIARGEVVIVEGHYGLRVTEVFAEAQQASLA